MAASSSHPETMKAEYSLDNLKVYSFLILFTIILLISYYTIYMMIIGNVS